MSFRTSWRFVQIVYSAGVLYVFACVQRVFALVGICRSECLPVIHKFFSPEYPILQLRDLFFFVCILIVFILSFGIAMQSLLYPNVAFTPRLILGRRLHSVLADFWRTIYGQNRRFPLENYIKTSNRQIECIKYAGTFEYGNKTILQGMLLKASARITPPCWRRTGR